MFLVFMQTYYLIYSGQKTYIEFPEIKAKASLSSVNNFV